MGDDDVEYVNMSLNLLWKLYQKIEHDVDSDRLPHEYVERCIRTLEQFNAEIDTAILINHYEPGLAKQYYDMIVTLLSQYPIT